MPSYKQSEVEDQHKAWPPGEYQVEIVSAEEKLSKAGNDMIVLKCKVIKDGEATGAKITEHLVFTPKAFFKVDQVRAAIGEIIVPDEEVDVVAEDFIGKRARVFLEVNADDDRWNEIKGWIKPDPTQFDRDGERIPF
jgi:hypothetical protein